MKLNNKKFEWRETYRCLNKVALKKANTDCHLPFVGDAGLMKNSLDERQRNNSDVVVESHAVIAAVVVVAAVAEALVVRALAANVVECSMVEEQQMIADIEMQ